MLLNRPNAMGIRDFAMGRAVHHIERINGRASLCVNARKWNQNIFAIKAAQHIV